jgi:hypothetical protein
MAGRILVLLIATMCAIVDSAAVAPVDVAKQFVPAGFGPHDKVDIAAAVTRFGVASGVRYIVAFYVTPEKAALRVLEERGDGWKVKKTNDLASSSCVSDAAVDFRDLDRDGRPEVIAACTGYPGNQTSTEIYRWTGAALVDAVGANGDEIVALGSTEYADLDANNRDEIVSVTTALVENENGDDARAVPVYTTYALRDGLYRLSGTLAYFDEIPLPAQKKTKTITREFVSARPGAYTLRVVRPATGSMAGIEIKLNDALVVGASQFSSSERVIAIPVSLQQTNAIVAKLIDAQRGPEGHDALAIAIEPNEPR